MSEIRTKLLGLSGLAMMFAGLSYGQVITCANGVPANNAIRQEGETELVSDATATCSNTLTTNGTVNATLSATVTSKSVTPTSTYAGNTDAVLQVTYACGAPQPACGTGVATGTTVYAYYSGLTSGALIQFTGVVYPVGTFNVQVSNVRVNANASASPQIVETLQVIYTNTSTLLATVAASLTGENVGYALTSLTSALAQNSSNQNIFYGTTTSNIATCNGYPLPTSSTGTILPAWTLNVKEGFAGAFKTMAQEQGDLVGTLNGTPIGTSTQATEIQVAFTNIPSAATIYLPITVSSNFTTLSLQGTGITPLTTPNALNVLNPPGVVAFTPSGGAVTAVYVVTTNTGTGTTFSIPVYLTVAAGAAPVQTTAMTVAATYIPAAAVTGPQATIPTFAVSTVSPINTLTVTPCQTTLLFPFVTNASGFETGIAIANMTTDNLAKSGASSSASPSSGTCTLWFYGNVATAPAPYNTPSIGAYSSSQSPVYANTLTSMAAPNFTGYAIALCNFLDAHAFAYIVDNFGQSSGTAEGYVANAINGSNRTGADGGQGQ